MNKKPETPFPVNGYQGPEYFCDREEELYQLSQYIKGGIPTVIFGIRRLGKSGLIKHLFHHMNHKGIFIDLQKTSSLQGLIRGLADGIGEAFPEKRHSKVWQMLKNFRPSVSFDPINGAPHFSFNMQKTEEVQETLKGLLRILSGINERITVAFDEFQEISKYPEQSVEGILRAEMQHFPTLNYIFSGSQTSLLSAMFQEGNRPFFANTSKLHLEKLDFEVYKKFSLALFEKYGKKVEESIIATALSWTECHTYYAQFVFNQLFLFSGKTITTQTLDRVQWQILQTARDDYFQMRELLSPGQRKLFVSIAKEGELFQPASNYLAKKYNLGTPSGVIKALDYLVERQQVNRLYTAKGEPFYKLSNVFIMRYISTYL